MVVMYSEIGRFSPRQKRAGTEFHGRDSSGRWRRKAVPRQNTLSFQRQNEASKVLRGRRRIVHDGQPVSGADRERGRQADDFLAGIFLLREQRIGAVGEK